MVYLDHNATTPLHPRVKRRLVQAMEEFGNPSTPYALGRRARQLLEEAREAVRGLLGAEGGRLVFTSGGTEANNLLLLGLALARGKGHLITTCVEHRAVLAPCRRLERMGFSVTYLPVDGHGRVDPDQVRRAIRPDTFLISVMAANNETGTVQPLQEIARIAQEHGIPLHTDAVQAVGKIPLRAQGLSAISVSGHKFGGPKGVGALWFREELNPQPLILGGGQEGGWRSGTENVLGAVGMGEACRAVGEELAQEGERLQRLSDWLLRTLQGRIPGMRLNGHPRWRLPNTLNLLLPGVPAEELVAEMDRRGFAIAAGSACHGSDPEPSHVLLAMGLSPAEARCCIRISLGRDTTREALEGFAEELCQAVEELRS